MPATVPHPGPNRAAFILTIWSDTTSASTPSWRGCLERGDGQRRYFRTLADLNHLLVQAGGWVDPPDSEPAGDDPAA